MSSILPTPTFATLSQARTILAIAKARGDNPKRVKILHEIDKLLDQRLALAGPPMCGCGRPKNTYGTLIYLCAECLRICSLTSVPCTHCGFVVAA